MLTVEERIDCLCMISMCQITHNFGNVIKTKYINDMLHKLFNIIYNKTIKKNDYQYINSLWKNLKKNIPNNLIYKGASYALPDIFTLKDNINKKYHTNISS